jgi:hypothetical protein
MAEKRRSQQDAGDHFGDYLRLSQPPSDCTHDAARHQDDGKLQEELDG